MLQQPPDNLHAIDFVAMNCSTDKHARPVLFTAYYMYGDFYRSMGIKTCNGQGNSLAFTRSNFNAGNTKIICVQAMSAFATCARFMRFGIFLDKLNDQPSDIFSGCLFNPLQTWR